MSRRATSRVRAGTRISGNLTVVSRLNPKDDSDAVFLVWDHRAWCPMVCKMFGTTRRARREAAALTTLKHPNIVRCLGICAPSYVLMEHLAGHKLGALIERAPGGRLSEADSCRVAIHIGAALSHMHANGFLHLDVKPDNIIVVHGRPVLFDFGSLRELGGRRRRGQIHGTDPYIAPEEWRLEQTNEAADVFSLGVTLYEMLTGCLPFGASSKSYASRSECRSLPLRRYRPRISRKLEALVLRCLSRNAADRPTMSELLPALHGEVRNGPKMWPETLTLVDGPAPARRQPRAA